MLYLHCGWPRTGTTSLQAALGQHAKAIADAGLVLLPTPKERRCLPRHVERSLEAYPGADLVLSDEGTTNMVGTDDLCNELLDLLHAIQEVTPVRCIWTLRRVDEVAHSGWIEMAARGLDGGMPVEFVRGFPPKPMFRSMQRVAEVIDGRVVYLKYQSSGAHNAELLESLGLPDELVTVISSSLRSSPRLHSSRTRKQLAALLNADELGGQLGIKLDRRALLAAFDSAGVRFSDDGPCELVGATVRCEAQERALANAEEAEFLPYRRFFAGEQVTCPPASRLGITALDDDDIDRLRRCLTGAGCPSDAAGRTSMTLIGEAPPPSSEI